jgi:hypothetical protein
MDLLSRYVIGIGIGMTALYLFMGKGDEIFSWTVLSSLVLIMVIDLIKNKTPD